MLDIVSVLFDFRVVERPTMHMLLFQLFSTQCEREDRVVKDRVDSGMEVPLLALHTTRVMMSLRKLPEGLLHFNVQNDLP